MGSSSFPRGSKRDLALREINQLRAAHGMKGKRRCIDFILRDSPDIFVELTALRAKPFRYKVSLCDDGQWMVHTEGDVIAYAGQDNEEDKARKIAAALNAMGN